MRFPGQNRHLLLSELCHKLMWLILSRAGIRLSLFFSYFITIPLANQFFSTFNHNLGINLWSLSSYVNYTMFLLFSHAISFELFVIIFFLVHHRIFSPSTLIRKRRHAVVAIFILSAILTPPDVLTQIMLVIPLIGLYELVIFYAKLMESQAKRGMVQKGII